LFNEIVEAYLALRAFDLRVFYVRGLNDAEESGNGEVTMVPHGTEEHGFTREVPAVAYIVNRAEPMVPSQTRICR
jgi:hypothetical protein